MSATQQARIQYHPVLPPEQSSPLAECRRAALQIGLPKDAPMSEVNAAIHHKLRCEAMDKGETIGD